MSLRKFDLTYLTVDSISEGVGSSQILPLLRILAKSGLSINLISFEKSSVSSDVSKKIEGDGIVWNPREFSKNGPHGGLLRLLEINKEIPETRLIHARSDIPAVAASLKKVAPILWDVRSLWAEQKSFIEENPFKKRVLKLYNGLEGLASFNSTAMSTLTASIVPVLESRHRSLPEIRAVVPTNVDLEHFQFHACDLNQIKGLYSGTYNNYYDLNISRLFIEELKKLCSMDVHWARPMESERRHLYAGESKVFESSQKSMASVIKDYNFGISVCKVDAGPSLKAAMPTKIAEFLSCGRPVVINKGLGDYDKYISEFRAGIILNGDILELPERAKEFLELLHDPGTSQRCRALAEKHFDINKGAVRYQNVYAEMLA